MEIRHYKTSTGVLLKIHYYQDSIFSQLKTSKKLKKLSSEPRAKAFKGLGSRPLLPKTRVTVTHWL